jgi:hypothetical protein
LPMAEQAGVSIHAFQPRQPREQRELGHPERERVQGELVIDIERRGW